MKKGYLLFLYSFLAIFNIAYSQKPKTENLPNFDQKALHFGFSLGINKADFDLKPIQDFTTLDSIHSIATIGKSGFDLGIICDLHLHPFWNLRFIPTLSFVQRNLEYTFNASNSVMEKTIESTFLNFPLLLKYRSARVNNFASYVIGGVKYSYDLASQAKVENIPGSFPDEIILKLKKNDYSIDLGVGFDFFLEYFKFSPELKVSFGIPNVLIQDGTMFSTPITKLNSRILLISFNFEG